MTSVPLVVDLDGTLLLTDMLHESALSFVSRNPFNLLKIPFWLMAGKAPMKQRLAQAVDVDASILPYNTELLAWLRQERQSGRRLVLCTATDRIFAMAVSEHLGIFDEVMASDGTNNLLGSKKAAALVSRFGAGAFDYAGDSEVDLAVWKVSRKAIVVTSGGGLDQRASDCCEVERVFRPVALTLSAFPAMLRVHQWLKNLLLFVPIFAAHQLTNTSSWWSLGLAFVSFSLCASAVYIANDLLDLESDRLHVRKRNRPFASGLIRVSQGCVLAPIFLLCSLFLGSFVGGTFLPWLVFYFLLTCLYSFYLKRMVMVDCLTLAMLYTLRIVAGAAAVGVSLSFWLLAFSVFLFLSLAFIKRYSELESQQRLGKEKAHGRGYFVTDAPLVMALGVASGYSAVLVLALYLNSEAVLKLYSSPEFVWGGVPIMLFWLSWMWMQAHRGKMHDDPLVFAVKDKASLFSGLLFAIMLTLGK
jgi:4-hydroxybenzoate polyprenyltransferase/phosphoserine phosphatase